MHKRADSSLADVFSGEQAPGPFDRLPPHAVDAEMCLLASMMLDRDIVGEVSERVRREDFYLADHQIIYHALVDLWTQNMGADRADDCVIMHDGTRR